MKTCAVIGAEGMERLSGVRKDFVAIRARGKRIGFRRSAESSEKRRLKAEAYAWETRMWVLLGIVAVICFIIANRESFASGSAENSGAIHEAAVPQISRIRSTEDFRSLDSLEGMEGTGTLKVLQPQFLQSAQARAFGLSGTGLTVPFSSGDESR